MTWVERDYTSESPVIQARYHGRLTEWLREYDPFYPWSRWWPKCEGCGSYLCEGAL